MVWAPRILPIRGSVPVPSVWFSLDWSGEVLWSRGVVVVLFVDLDGLGASRPMDCRFGLASFELWGRLCGSGVVLAECICAASMIRR